MSFAKYCSCVSLLGLIILNSAVAQDAVDKERKRLQGTWIAVSFEENGSKFTDQDELKKIGLKIVFNEKKLALTVEGKTVDSDYSLDPAKTPKEIDIAGIGNEKNVPVLCIYEWNGDTLKIGLGKKEGGSRPTQFKTESNSGCATVVLRREKQQKDQ